MTVKQFFKSTVFKCLVTLLCVLLVCGVFLTVMNGLLEVTDQERFDRAIKKIYGKSVTTTAETISVQPNPDTVIINEAYKVKDDGNYLIKSTGLGGFDSGTVTCWVVVVIKNGAVAGVDKVVIDSNKGQSYISKVTQSFLNKFANDPAEDFYFTTTDGYLSSGATRSSNAICNAVNGAVDFVNAKLGNSASNPFEGFDYVQYIDTKKTEVPVYDEETETVTFHIQTASYGDAGNFLIDVTVDKNGVITDYTITTNGCTGGYDSKMLASIKDGSLFKGKDIEGILGILDNGVDLSYPSGSVLNTGATQGNFLCLHAAAFAAANYDNYLPEVEEGDAEGGNA